MNKTDRWDQRYADRLFSEGDAAFVLSENKHLLPTTGSAIDIACGFGANAIFLARMGLAVDAVDYSAIALQKLTEYCQQHALEVAAIEQDLEAAFAINKQYDVVVISYYLQRDLFPKLLNLVRPGGLFFYQTFSGDPRSDSTPKNPDFRLRAGELIDLCSDHSILYYREDSGHCKADSDVPCFNEEAMIVVRKSA